MKRRIFYRDILNHCYQRTADGGVLFYSVSDHLVYFTLYCTLARKHSIQVLSLCQMPDHIHDAVRAGRRDALEEFKRETNMQFSRMRNELCRVSGAVFESPFGSAPSYNVIDYDAAISFFDSYEDMLVAMHATTGSEHDLNEIFIGKSDAHYKRMTTIVLREGSVKDVHDIPAMSVDEKYDLFLLLRRMTEAPAEQIAHFLHMPLIRA